MRASCTSRADGDDLRGEDKLTGRAGRGFRGALSPAPVGRRRRWSRTAARALLRLPSGAVWRLRAAGAEMSLGESIYLGAGEVAEDPAGGAERHDRAERRHGALGAAPRDNAAGGELQGVGGDPV